MAFLRFLVESNKNKMALKGHKGKRVRKRNKKKKHIEIIKPNERLMEELSVTPPPTPTSTPEIPSLPPIPSQLEYDFVESLRDTIALAEAKIEIMNLKMIIHRDAVRDLEKMEEDLEERKHMLDSREMELNKREAIVEKREIKTSPLLVRSDGINWNPKVKSNIFPESEIYISAPKPYKKWTAPNPPGFPTSLDKNIFWKNSLGY